MFDKMFEILSQEIHEIAHIMGHEGLRGLHTTDLEQVEDLDR